ncbi:acnA, partial [Symbiodinium microadriaticum]
LLAVDFAYSVGTQVALEVDCKDSRHIHFIGIYQKAFDPKASTAEQRQQVWLALDRCLAGIPARDSLALMGDFNTSLKPQVPHVGAHTNPLSCHPPEDMTDFSALLVTYDLVALNTWSRPVDRKLPYTFKFQDTESQIDFILTRRADATAQARRARAWRNFHVGASRHSGAIHFPLQALLVLRCPHWVRQPPQVRPSIDREALLAALETPTDPEHLAQTASVRQAVAGHMATTSGIQGVSTLHHTLFQVCSTIFPAQKKQRALHPLQTPEVQQGIKTMWEQWRAFKKIRKNGLRGWFAAWKSWKSFDRQYRAHQLRCRQARRAKLLNAMEEAQDSTIAIDLAGYVTYERLCAMLTIFAGDYHAAGAQSFGMEVSDAKSQAILVLKGHPEYIHPLMLETLLTREGYKKCQGADAHVCICIDNIAWYVDKGLFVPRTQAVAACACTVTLQWQYLGCISLLAPPCGCSASTSLLPMAGVDQEIKEVFGDLAQNSLQSFGEALFGTGSQGLGTEPPPKAPKLEPASSKRQRPSDSAGSHGSQGQWGNKGRGKGNKQQPQLHALAHAMGRLIIRQETQLQILKQNSAWTLYLKPGPSGPALLDSLQGISSSTEKQQILKDEGWLNSDGNWKYQKWDGEQQALVIDESRQPMNHQDLIGKVGQFSEIVLSKDVIHRFNATHSLSPAKTGTSTFLLEVGLRASGVETAWAILEMISGLSALQVIGLQIRREGLRRGGLANEVQKLMCLYRLVLHNPSNQCYLNAFAYMYLWCHCRLEAPEYQLFGTKIQAWRDVLYTAQRPLTISRLPSWRSLLRGWRQPASQHDVADFMMHVIRILDPPQLQATWEARWETEQGIVCQDSGRLSCPIVLPLLLYIKH